MYRPEGWGMPECFNVRVLRNGEWVDEPMHNNGARDSIAFEAGADAMLEALVENGWLEEYNMVDEAPEEE